MLDTVRKLSINILVGSAVITMAAMPIVSWADASAPGIDRVHKAKPKMRHRMVKPRVVRMAKPAPDQVVQDVPPAPPVAPEAPPAPAVAEAPPAPPMEAPAPPAAPLAVAKKGGKGILIGLIGAAAVIAGIVVAADSSSTSP